MAVLAPNRLGWFVISPIAAPSVPAGFWVRRRMKNWLAEREQEMQAQDRSFIFFVAA
jgi:hypothetical protein